MLNSLVAIAVPGGTTGFYQTNATTEYAMPTLVVCAGPGGAWDSAHRDGSTRDAPTKAHAAALFLLSRDIDCLAQQGRVQIVVRATRATEQLVKRASGNIWEEGAQNHDLSTLGTGD